MELAPKNEEKRHVIDEADEGFLNMTYSQILEITM